LACELKSEVVYSDRPVITSKQVPYREMTNRHPNCIVKSSVTKDVYEVRSLKILCIILTTVF
jgi:hypothetical protein